MRKCKTYIPRGHQSLTCVLFGVLLLASDAFGDTDVRLYPDQPRQTIWGFGFEIQCDSIGSGNNGLPDHRASVPHDLTDLERQRLADEMLNGFRYCRLAGGLYWRGLDESGRTLRPRWPTQLTELRTLLERAGVEGLSLEYWSPAPYWKGNRRLVSERGGDPANTLRCFAPGFDQDPEYRGDRQRFLSDFAKACVADIRHLDAAGIKTRMWGLQNEPFVSNGKYSSCKYHSSEDYVAAFSAVAAAVRQHDPSILIMADTESNFPSKIAPAMTEPAVAQLVDAYVVHTIGAPSENVRQVHRKIRERLPERPWFQNEYEYLTGRATPRRCLNTVQHIMNSFQIGQNPTWFWIHALKPYKNAEASGYSLGFWKSPSDTNRDFSQDVYRRWRDGAELSELPNEFSACEMISATRGKRSAPGVGFMFRTNQPVSVFLLVHQMGDYTPEGWQATDWSAEWEDQQDKIYRRDFSAGDIRIPPHTGQEGSEYGAPHAAFVRPSDPSTMELAIGVNMPIEIRSHAMQLEKTMAEVRAGHWFYNPYNWNAVGSFVKRMPWDCQAIKIEESKSHPHARVFAFRRPNGKHTMVFSNRSGQNYTFKVQTQLKGSRWSGFRYTPDNAGADTGGVPIGQQDGSKVEFELSHLSWEFWEQL